MHGKIKGYGFLVLILSTFLYANGLFAQTQDERLGHNWGGAITYEPRGPGVLFDKFQAYSDTNSGINYKIENLNFKSGPAYDDDDRGNLIWIQTLDVGDWTPPFIIDGVTATNLASSCAKPSDYELEVWPSAPPGLIYRATTATEIRDFNDPDYDGAYYQNPASGGLILKLQGTQSLSGSPNVFQHEAQGRFDLVCPVPEAGSLVMLAAGLGLLRALPKRRAQSALRH